jgi:7-cyano-7-deazaguanine reductase
MSRDTPLGKTASYSSHYDADLLYAIARSESRSKLGVRTALPFSGVDIWTAWELTWLNPSGVPQLAAVEIRVPCDSPQLIESKSLKLYLNSFTMSRFASADEVQTAIRRDLGECTGATVVVRFFSSGQALPPHAPAGHCIDGSETRCEVFDVDANLLSAGGPVVTERLHSDLLRSLCPVTNQPDIGSVLIAYTGPQVEYASLLRYIVSYREHNDFHEACVERMFIDILGRCRPTQLSVYARYQRRGGIDINPFRSNFESNPSNLRLWRQ